MQTFHDVPRQKLRELIDAEGSAILDAPERCKGWLLYSCPEYKREVNVLLAALSQGVPQELLASGDEEALVRRLVDESAMTEEAAWWAVKSWAGALEMPVPVEAIAAEESIASGPVARFLADDPEPAVNSKGGLHPSVRKPAQAVAEELSNCESRELLIQSLEGIVKAHEQTKKASEEDITGKVAGAGVIFAFILGFVGYHIAAASSSYSTRDTNGVLGAVIGIVAAFLIAYYLVSHDKGKETDSAKEKLVTLMNRVTDSFPQAIHSFGGPSILSDPDTLRQVICALKANESIPRAEAPRLPAKVSQGIPAGAGVPLQSHRGPLILTLGVIGWFFPLLAVIAWIMGHSDLQAMQAGKMDPAGQSQTSSGKTLGMIATLLWGGLILLGVIARR